MKEGLERDGKEASEGSFDLLEVFVFWGDSMNTEGFKRKLSAILTLNYCHIG